ncbi:MAG: hypothetical protein KKB81_03615 [Candidatus Margulisbacteria bacterium]|nr:hypothetical protein [Candidatus Margulisiibacteriota bacterium]MBU1022334.1 hypothetical protein [Candidatus Margulisiibacteriota bacterium]MBU1729584.1 hypothetical protein [Candidatus Margulisiibacteriota bacterium]MBU1955070.1 hypothetical protein [Candidatus Margulisiibacteriota bacterium]
MGKTGRALLRLPARYKRLDRAIDLFSNGAHKLLGKRYIPRLTRDMFNLHQTLQARGIQPGTEITIAPDGFFVGEERLGSNPIGDCFKLRNKEEARPITVKLDSHIPETLIDYARLINRTNRNGLGVGIGLIGLDSIFPGILEKARSIDDINAWVSGIEALHHDYTRVQELSEPAAYMVGALPWIIRRSDSIENLRKLDPRVRAMLAEGKRATPLGNNDYHNYIFPAILGRAQTIQEAEALHILSIHHLKKFYSSFANGLESDFARMGLAPLIRSGKSPLEIYEYCMVIFDVVTAFVNKFGYDNLERIIMNISLPRLLEKAPFASEFSLWGAAAFNLTREFQEDFDNEQIYARRLLPLYLCRAESANELFEWDAQARILIENYKWLTGGLNSNLPPYLVAILPNIVALAESIADFRSMVPGIVRIQGQGVEILAGDRPVDDSKLH